MEDLSVNLSQEARWCTYLPLCKFWAIVRTHIST